MRLRRPIGVIGALISHHSDGAAHTLTIDALSRRASTIRRGTGLRLPPHPVDAVAELSFHSSYAKPGGSGRRGFCNWIIPYRVMAGQYPGRTPEDWGPTAEQAEKHVRSVVRDARVTTFCCLQSEVPPQDDDTAWAAKGGEVYLSYPWRSQFPRSFTRYSPVVRSELSVGDDDLPHPEEVKIPEFLHQPVEDLNVPDSSSLLELLSRLLDVMEDDRTVYIHCWGGRGRAGLVGACLTSLLFPELDKRFILDLVQAGYDTRLGAEEMPEGLRTSPQTEEQRAFVEKFVEERRRQAK